MSVIGGGDDLVTRLGIERGDADVHRRGARGHATAWRRPSQRRDPRLELGRLRALGAVSVPDSITARERASSSAPNERPLASWSDGSPSGAARQCRLPVPALGFSDRRSVARDRATTVTVVFPILG